MARMLIIALILTIASNILYSQDYGCTRWPPAPLVITSENVQQLCNLGADPGRIIEARWHKTEPNLILLNRPDLSATDQAVFHIAVWDVERNKGTRFRTRGRTFSQLEVAANTVIVGTKTGSLLLWDLGQEVFLYVVPVHAGEVSELLLHSSDKWLLVVIDQEKLFRYDFQSREVTEIHLQYSKFLPLHAVAFSDDGRLVAAAGDGYVGIWNTKDWATRQPVASYSESAVTLHFVDDDSHLILLTDKSVSRWSLDGNGLKLVRKLEPHQLKRQCTFLGGDISPDDSLLMTTDECGQLRAWDLRLDQEIHIPQLRYIGEDHVGVPTRFSPDGRYLVDRVEPYGFMLLIAPEHE